MLDEVIMDCAIQAHREVTRSRAVCDICKTRYVFGINALTGTSCAHSSRGHAVADKVRECRFAASRVIDPLNSTSSTGCEPSAPQLPRTVSSSGIRNCEPGRGVRTERE